MRVAALADDLDQIRVAEGSAHRQKRARDTDLVVGKGQHQFARRIGRIGEALGQTLANLDFGLANQLAHDIGRNLEGGLIERAGRIG